MAHWKRHRPTMYPEPKQTGALDETVSTAEITANALYDLTMVKKMPDDQTWELVRQEWALLPEE